MNTHMDIFITTKPLAQVLEGQLTMKRGRTLQNPRSGMATARLATVCFNLFPVRTFLYLNIHDEQIILADFIDAVYRTETKIHP
jgi:hypothetical protein